MKTLYIDCRSGASGDMFLGAFLDLGIPQHVLTDNLASLGLNEFTLQIKKTDCRGINVTDVDVVLHDKENAWIHPYSGKYRNYGEIKEMIDRSCLSDNAKAISRRIFDIKAEAESEAHRVPVDEVQFHEVGAVDSIVDIVGAAICCDYLSIDKIYSTSVPTGFGTIMCACGELPVPAPATQAIIKNTGLPNYRSDIEQELLTPTGASILAGIVDEFIDDNVMDDIYSDKEGEQTLIGRGTGKRDTGLSPLCLLLRTTVR